MKNYKLIKAKDVESEEQLKLLLEESGIASLSLKDAKWLSHWWDQEHFSINQITRVVSVRGDANYNPALCISVIEGKFEIFRFDETNQWFDKLGELLEFQVDEFKAYLENLVNRDLENWQKWFKQQSSK
jgi:hypothetical protein